MEIILGLRILRNEVACYSGGNLLQRGLDSEEKYGETPGKGRAGWCEEDAGRGNGACFRTLWWTPVGQHWKVIMKKRRQRGNPHSWVWSERGALPCWGARRHAGANEMMSPRCPRGIRAKMSWERDSESEPSNLESLKRELCGWCGDQEWVQSLGKEILPRTDDGQVLPKDHAGKHLESE